MHYKKTAPQISFLLLLILLSGCTFLSPPPVPFRYISVSVETGPSAGLHERLGIHLRLKNISSGTIRDFRASCYLYDCEGRQVPAFGDHYFLLRQHCSIAPGEEKTFVFCLDAFFSDYSAAPYLADQFHISRVDFSDGRSWTDNFKIHVYRGGVSADAARRAGGRE
jgi:hypothetical protein